MPGGLDTGFISCALRFMVLAAATSALVLTSVFWWSGMAGLQTAGLAATLCVAAGFLALAVTAWQARQGRPLPAMLCGMAARMVPLLLVCLLLASGHQADILPGSQDLTRSFAAYLVIFYLVTLAIETPLCLKFLQYPKIEVHSKGS
jgi:hypothetical protein